MNVTIDKLHCIFILLTTICVNVDQKLLSYWILSDKEVLGKTMR